MLMIRLHDVCSQACAWPSRFRDTYQAIHSYPHYNYYMKILLCMYQAMRVCVLYIANLISVVLAMPPQTSKAGC